MKMRNKSKGKIHPSPSSSSSSPSNALPNKNALSVLALLPAAILALISVLSAGDKEVLAYMVTRSMNSTSPSSSSAEEKTKKSTKKELASSSSCVILHMVPVFDCECFECYKSYWFRWDSSPDKELIHKAIEEFEDFLFSQEQGKRTGAGAGKGKRRERVGRLVRDKAKEEREEVFEEREEILEEGFVVGNELVVEEVAREEVVEEEAAAAVVVVDNYNKGLVRKVLPDVVGLLNSRLWGLWSPNV